MTHIHHSFCYQSLELRLIHFIQCQAVRQNHLFRCSLRHLTRDLPVRLFTASISIKPHPQLSAWDEPLLSEFIHLTNSLMMTQPFVMSAQHDMQNSALVIITDASE